MKERIILFYFNNKAKEKFSGGIKMGFENGCPNSCAENTNSDFNAPEIEADFDLEEKIKTACGLGFYGTLFFVYESSNIISFYQTRTWQGKDLEAMLIRQVSPPKRFVVAVKR